MCNLALATPRLYSGVVSLSSKGGIHCEWNRYILRFEEPTSSSVPST